MHLSSNESGAHESASRRHGRHWRDTTAAVALDVISKIFVICGTPIIGWVLLTVVDHASRLSTMEARIAEQAVATKDRWNTVDASLIRLETKVDRLVERKQVP